MSTYRMKGGRDASEHGRVRLGNGKRLHITRDRWLRTLCGRKIERRSKFPESAGLCMRCETIQERWFEKVAE